MSGSFRRQFELGLKARELKDTETAASKFDDMLQTYQARQKTARNALAIRRFKTRACSYRRKSDDQGIRLWIEMKMVKETKFFRKQGEKAERMALATSDEEASQSLSNLAQAYRSQADALKKSKTLKKSKKMSGKKAKLKVKK